MRTLIILGLTLLAGAAYAQFNGCAPGFCSAGTGGGGGSGNFLLSETGSALLVDTGVKFLVQ
jgi:hypothetical protein